MGLDVNSPEFLNLRRACEMGNPQGCTIFGAGLSRVPTVSGKRVLKFLRLGCEKVFGCVCGFGFRIFGLGGMRQQGVGKILLK